MFEVTIANRGVPPTSPGREVAARRSVGHGRHEAAGTKGLL